MAKLGLKEAILGALALNCNTPDKKPTEPTEKEMWAQRICDEEVSVQREKMLSIIAAVQPPEKRDQFKDLPDLVAEKVRQECETKWGTAKNR